MAKRAFDVFFSAIALIAMSPVLLITALGIRLTSPGPVIYRAERVGLNGRPFTMYKFRSMCASPRTGARITAANDSRVYPFGAFLRRSKLDEWPQFLNVLLGELSIVGPRPEDPAIVAAHYSSEDLETLGIKPGLVSPGSLFNYTHGDLFLDGASADAPYAAELLPIKLALELVYVRNASMSYDLRLIARTVLIIAQRLFGRTRFALPPEASVIDGPYSASLRRVVRMWPVTDSLSHFKP